MERWVKRWYIACNPRYTYGCAVPGFVMVVLRVPKDSGLYLLMFCELLYLQQCQWINSGKSVQRRTKRKWVKSTGLWLYKVTQQSPTRVHSPQDIIYKKNRDFFTLMECIKLNFYIELTISFPMITWYLGISIQRMQMNQWCKVVLCITTTTIYATEA